MNNKGTDALDRKPMPASQRKKSSASSLICAVVFGFLAARKLYEIFGTGTASWELVMAVVYALAAVGCLWEGVRPHEPSPRMNVFAKGILFAMLLGLTTYCTHSYLASREQWDAYWAVVTGLMSAVALWDLLLPRRGADQAVGE